MPTQTELSAHAVALLRDAGAETANFDVDPLFREAPSDVEVGGLLREVASGSDADSSRSSTVADGLSVEGRSALEAAYPATTIGTYETQWRLFQAWAVGVSSDGEPLVQPTVTDVVNYIGYLTHVRRLSHSSINTAVCALRWVLPKIGAADVASHEWVALALRGAGRSIAADSPDRQPKKSQALTIDGLRRCVMAVEMPPGPRPQPRAVHRAQALLLVGWWAALRRSELVGLRINDVTMTETPDGRPCFELRIRRSKNHQLNAIHKILVRVDADAGPEMIQLCPFRALETWLAYVTVDEFDLSSDSPLFRRFARDQSGVTSEPLSGSSMNEIVKRAAVWAGLQPKGATRGFTAHSLRGGFVTYMRSRDVPAERVMAVTGHRDPRSVLRYVETDDIDAAMECMDAALAAAGNRDCQTS